MNKDIVEREDICFVDPCKNSVYSEKKYVEVNEAIKTIRNASPTKVWDALQVLAEMNGEDVAQVVHGHWLLEREPSGKPYCFHCSVCDNDFHYIGITTGYDYCPLCGAKMDGEYKQ